ncbi:helix-turn-helix domain-containing protein [Qipengyuania sp. XHP0211]|uniref:helix-turn-helix domain-containing protein n=1 Tax=Qipengyuania sp. XHP0211 TaxID=3038079 RepID=UPI00241C8142|nr:helix-turn-helix domain-containing protein [Qipengyuania sp. XHP0211]MDG5751968.1 helix-turn-helix domain-containing protein [Qipengyuania sp. XHP0211]
MKHEPLSSVSGGRKIEPLAYSMEEAAAMLGISRGKLYRILNVGEIGGKKLGRRTIILHSDLVKFLDNLPNCDEESNFY